MIDYFGICDCGWEHKGKTSFLSIHESRRHLRLSGCPGKEVWVERLVDGKPDERIKPTIIKKRGKSQIYV